MPLRLDSSAADFEARFAAFADARRGAEEDVARDVAAIVAEVRADGDAALARLTRKFDGFDPQETGWRIAPEQCSAALAGLPGELRDALTLAAERIRAFHASQKPEDSDFTDAQGVRMGARWTPVDVAGLYVPGGRAAYPSSLLMNALPAVCAGVERLVMVSPTPGGEANPLVLAAAEIAGVQEIYRVGGAQAVAALAVGTEAIPRADMVVGPGNAWVAEAKRQLYGTVGIDMVAGPSEILIVSDAASDPDWIAADLLAQAEHDPTAQSILMTDDADFAEAVAAAVERQLGEIATGETAGDSWNRNGAVILLRDLAEAPALVDRLAPEHLELAVDDPEPLFARIRHAGAVFLGRRTPEAIGDYLGGPNHVLPTGRRARFASGLSVLDFMKRTSFLDCGERGLAALGPAAIALAEAEGLPAHARSVFERLK